MHSAARIWPLFVFLAIDSNLRSGNRLMKYEQFGKTDEKYNKNEAF
jgi:hypothetical protein